MSESLKLIEKWVNGKFEAKINVSLLQRGNFLNPTLSLINGKSYNTKLGPSMAVQFGYNEIQDLIETLQSIQGKMKENFASQDRKNESNRE